MFEKFKSIRISLCLMAISIVLLCGFVSTRDEKYVSYFLHLYSAGLFREHNFTLHDAGASFGKDHIHRIEMSLSCYKALPLVHARQLVTTLAMDFLEKINNDPGLKEKGLIKEKFIPRQLTLRILCDNAISETYETIYIREIILDRGQLTYVSFKNMKEIWGKSYTVHEDFDYALMLTGNPRPSDDVIDESRIIPQLRAMRGDTSDIPVREHEELLYPARTIPKESLEPRESAIAPLEPITVSVEMFSQLNLAPPPKETEDEVVTPKVTEGAATPPQPTATAPTPAVGPTGAQTGAQTPLPTQAAAEIKEIVPTLPVTVPPGTIPPATLPPATVPQSSDRLKQAEAESSKLLSKRGEPPEEDKNHIPTLPEQLADAETAKEPANDEQIDLLGLFDDFTSSFTPKSSEEAEHAPPKENAVPESLVAINDDDDQSEDSTPPDEDFDMPEYEYNEPSSQQLATDEGLEAGVEDFNDREAELLAQELEGAIELDPRVESLFAKQDEDENAAGPDDELIDEIETQELKIALNEKAADEKAADESQAASIDEEIIAEDDQLATAAWASLITNENEADAESESPDEELIQSLVAEETQVPAEEPSQAEPVPPITPDDELIVELEAEPVPVEEAVGAKIEEKPSKPWWQRLFESDKPEQQEPKSKELEPKVLEQEEHVVAKDEPAPEQSPDEEVVAALIAQDAQDQYETAEDLSLIEAPTPDDELVLELETETAPGEETVAVETEEKPSKTWWQGLFESDKSKQKEPEPKVLQQEEHVVAKDEPTPAYSPDEELVEALITQELQDQYETAEELSPIESPTPDDEIVLELEAEEAETLAAADAEVSKEVIVAGTEEKPSQSLWKRLFASNETTQTEPKQVEPEQKGPEQTEPLSSTTPDDEIVLELEAEEAETLAAADAEVSKEDIVAGTEEKPSQSWWQRLFASNETTQTEPEQGEPEQKEPLSSATPDDEIVLELEAEEAETLATADAEVSKEVIVAGTEEKPSQSLWQRLFASNETTQTEPEQVEPDQAEPLPPTTPDDELVLELEAEPAPGTEEEKPSKSWWKRLFGSNEETENKAADEQVTAEFVEVQPSPDEEVVSQVEAEELEVARNEKASVDESLIAEAEDDQHSTPAWGSLSISEQTDPDVEDEHVPTPSSDEKEFDAVVTQHAPQEVQIQYEKAPEPSQIESLPSATPSDNVIFELEAEDAQPDEQNPVQKETEEQPADEAPVSPVEEPQIAEDNQPSTAIWESISIAEQNDAEVAAALFPTESPDEELVQAVVTQEAPEEVQVQYEKAVEPTETEPAKEESPSATAPDNEVVFEFEAEETSPQSFWQPLFGSNEDDESQNETAVLSPTPDEEVISQVEAEELEIARNKKAAQELSIVASDEEEMADEQEEQNAAVAEEAIVEPTEEPQSQSWWQQLFASDEPEQEAPEQEEPIQEEPIQEEPTQDEPVIAEGTVEEAAEKAPSQSLWQRLFATSEPEQQKEPEQDEPLAAEAVRVAFVPSSPTPDDEVLSEIETEEQEIARQEIERQEIERQEIERQEIERQEIANLGKAVYEGTIFVADSPKEEDPAPNESEEKPSASFWQSLFGSNEEANDTAAPETPVTNSKEPIQTQASPPPEEVSDEQVEVDASPSWWQNLFASKDEPASEEEGAAKDAQEPKEETVILATEEESLPTEKEETSSWWQNLFSSNDDAEDDAEPDEENVPVEEQLAEDSDTPSAKSWLQSLFSSDDDESAPDAPSEEDEQNQDEDEPVLEAAPETESSQSWWQRIFSSNDAPETDDSEPESSDGAPSQEVLPQQETDNHDPVLKALYSEPISWFESRSAQPAAGGWGDNSDEPVPPQNSDDQDPGS